MELLVFLLAVYVGLATSIGSVIDRYALKNHFKHPITYQIVIQFGLFLFIPLFYFLFDIVWDLNYFIFGILLGFGFASTYFLWSFAVKDEEISIVAPLSNLGPLFVFFLAIIFLGESLSIDKIIGIFLAAGAAILLTYSSKTKLKLTKQLGYLFVFVFLMAIGTVLIKVAVVNFDPISFMFYTFFGGIMMIPLIWFKKSWTKQFFEKDIKQLWWVWCLVIFVNFGIFLTGLVIFYNLLSQYSVSIINAINIAVQPLFVLLISFIITMINPKWLGERFDTKTLTLKIVGVLLLSAGVYLLAI